MKKRCNSCVGSGRVMGGGMMMQDCEVCDGVGKIFVAEEKIMLKDSEAYNNAKEKIKNLDEKLTNADAEKLLDDELSKLDDESKVVRITKKKAKPNGEKAS